MSRLLFAAILVLPALACSSIPPPAPPPEETVPEVPDASAPAPLPEPEWPWPAVTSDDGRFTLQPQRVARESGLVTVQGQIELGPDQILVRGIRIRRLASAGDPGATKPHPNARHPMILGQGGFVLFGLDVGEVKRIALLELECPILVVRTWKTFVLEKLENGKPGTLSAPPFELPVNGEDHRVSVGAGMDGEAYRDAGLADLPRLIDHRWAARTARVTDANGKGLVSMGGAGSGGFTVGFFHPVTEGVAEFPTGEVAYSVRVELRVPDRYDLVPAVFRIRNLEIPSE